MRASGGARRGSGQGGGIGGRAGGCLCAPPSSAARARVRTHAHASKRKRTRALPSHQRARGPLSPAPRCAVLVRDGLYRIAIELLEAIELLAVCLVLNLPLGWPSPPLPVALSSAGGAAGGTHTRTHTHAHTHTHTRTHTHTGAPFIGVGSGWRSASKPGLSIA